MLGTQRHRVRLSLRPDQLHETADDAMKGGELELRPWPRGARFGKIRSNGRRGCHLAPPSLADLLGGRQAHGSQGFPSLISQL